MRDFIKVIAGSIAWPLAASAQQGEQKRRIGVLMNRAANDAEGQARLAAFRQALEQLGWREGRNVRLDIRWGEDKTDLQRKYAAELVALAPDVILASGTMNVTEVQALSRKLPIVFAAVADPVGAGFVESMAHPGGNATGFMLYEYSLGGKLLELLKEIAPGVTRVAVLRDPANPGLVATFGAVRGAAHLLGVEVTAIDTRDAAEIERGVTAFGRSANGGEADGQGHRSGERSDRQDAIAKRAGERRRDGAFDWGVFEDTEREGRFVKTFKVDSWIEHLRQHERVTHADREVQESVNRFEINGAPKVTHLIACA